ncbi:MAG: aminoglycoside phosphotransferase family protein [Kineosporiaceae bacterium]
MHPDQLDIRDATVTALVADQFPAWADRPLRRVAGDGTVNAVFRLGEDLSVRLPLRAEDPGAVRRWLESEAAACRELAAGCPFPAPVPVALGEPGHGYPLPWAVQTWLPGRDATVEDPGGSDAFADDLALLLTNLRAMDTRGRRFAGRGRGGDLTTHDDWVEECLGRSEGLLDVPRSRDLWTSLRTLPRPDRDAMCHSDLVPGNVLVRDGRLAGVLDGGGFGPADPALDLVSAWHLLDAGPRERLRRGLGCGDVEWGRGMAWALVQALGLAWYYRESNPGLARTGRRTIVRLLAAI